MGLTTAMYTSLSGMNANQSRIDNIGNNIANVNTTAFKNTRTTFQSHISQLLSAGNAPSETSGGVNPTQIGLGTLVAATQRDYTPGSIETTGIASDLAIEGAGLFIVQRPSGQQAYTRDGAFAVDIDNKLVTADGYRVMGFGVDANYNILPNVLTELTIPLGTLSVARATTTAIMDGDLSAAGTVATQGSTHLSQALVNGGGAAADASTALTDLRSASDPATALFADGTTITLSGATRGGRTLPDATFVVGTDGSSLGDFASWLEESLGIQTGDGLPGTPGVTIVDGQLSISSNAGEQNGFELIASNLFSDNTGVALPFSFTQTAEANGSSVYTGFTVYDSLGTPIVVNATFALEQTLDTGHVWRFYLESAGADGTPQPVSTGTVTFDVNGNYVSATGNEVQLDRTASGAASPLAFTLDFSGVHGLSTAASNLILAQQDGFPPGTLVSYSVGSDGTVNGAFSNGLTHPLGQVALAVFANERGLIADSDNLYLQGPNTGAPTVTAPGLFGAGRVLGGALELSNVDLSREFIGLITSSTAFQAASRVISTSSDLLDQLLLVVR